MKTAWLNLWIAGAVLLGPGFAAAQTEALPENKEYLLKSVYLYALGCNMQWPPSAFARPGDPFVIGVLGPDRFGKTLQDIAQKKKLQGRKIVVKNFTSLKDYRGPCQMLFVSGSLNEEEQKKALRELPRKGLLLVGENPGFAEDGGIVNFFREEDRIRFEINAEAAKRAELEMGAQLLKLAEPVNRRRSADNHSSFLYPTPMSLIR
jgi:hypothetical protein